MNIFVANINFKTRKEDLEATFAAYGQVVAVKILRDRESGRSKGFGFVEMAVEEEAMKAIEALNGFELDSRPLIVKLANNSGGASSAA